MQKIIYIAAPFVLVALIVTVVVKIIYPRQVPTTHTVSWFLSNPSILASTYATCQNDPGGIGKTPDCQNAQEADAQQVEKNAWKYTPPANVVIPNPFPNAGNSTPHAQGKSP